MLRTFLDVACARLFEILKEKIKKGIDKRGGM